MKRYISLLVLIGFLFTSTVSIFPSEAFAKVAPIGISASSVYMMDETRGSVLLARRENKKAQAASTVKVLTALVVAERIPLDRIVTVPAGVESIQPSKVYLRTGERYSVESLLKALLLHSANDSAYALAITSAGSERQFCQWMNERARKAGANSSNFVTPHGLPDPRQYTTAKDLTSIMRAAERNPIIVRIMKQKTATIYSTAGRRIVCRNHNKLLWRDPRDIIGKTGYTRAARKCFVGRMAHANRIFVFAIMGSVNLWRDLAILLNAFSAKPSLKKAATKKLEAAGETRRAQEALKKRGFYTGKLDGLMGPGTRRAIRSFQKKNGLKADGVLGPKTRTLLFA